MTEMADSKHTRPAPRPSGRSVVRRAPKPNAGREPTREEEESVEGQAFFWARRRRD
jgi:hypothetical protein